MAQEKFNTSIKLGGKAYPPGSLVPVGGKGGLSEEEARNIRAAFGPWVEEAGTAARQVSDDDLKDDVAELKAKLADVTRSHAAEVERLQTDIKRVSAEKAKLVDLIDEANAEKVKLAEELEQAKADCVTLSAEVERLSKYEKGDAGK